MSTSEATGTAFAPAGDPANPTRTLGAALRRARVQSPDAEAVVCGEVRSTYRELGARVDAVAAALHARGLRPGDRVAVLGANSHRYLELYLALPASGLVIVPLNVRHTDAEHRYVLGDSGACLLLTDRPVEGAEIETLDLADDYEELLAGADGTPPAHEAAEHDLAGIFYTGGTTGDAKGVMLTHGNLVANAFHFMACWPFTPGTRWLVVAPMFHAAGTIATLATVWAGGTQVIMPGFSADGVLDTIADEGVTATLVVPTMMDALATEQDARPRDVSSLRWLSHGSSPAAVELLRRTRETFPDAEMLHIYGLTETSPIVTLLPGEQHLLDHPRARSCGRAAVGVEVEILDPGSGEPAGPEVVGEVRIRGANVTAGYWNKPEETAGALRDGWFSSGDLGYLDEGGFLFLVDRAKDMIVSGGENVYSAEVENALYAHPAVVEAAVFGIPSERYGEAVHAVVTVRSEVDDDDLVAHCRASIAGYKVPRSVEQRHDPLPKSGAGKILKRELRDAWWSGREARI